MDMNPRYENLTRGIAFSFAIGGILFAMLTDHIKGANWLLVVPVLSFLLVLVVYFHLRRIFWFWVTILSITAGQISLVFLFAVPKIVTGLPLIMMALTLCDTFLIIEFIKSIGRNVERR
jgi:hypothetical protein